MKYIDFWVQQEAVFKQNVKTAITATLASPSKLVRSQVASLVAAIAAIEIPRGEWTELISTLCTNSSNESLEIKLASLQTLGFICEELNPQDLTKELTD